MSLEQAVAGAWRAFDRAAQLSCRVTEAVPILFFGDLNAYQASPVRILTVGLNPSSDEFPIDEPYRRFPLAENSRGQELSRYLDAMSAYFRTDPYRNWFSAFEPLLNGMEASYYKGSASTALHTDICSPVATDPKWKTLSDSQRAELAKDGVPLWHMLLKTLQPEIVAISVAKEHLGSIAFAPLTDWKVARAFKAKKNGCLRKYPYNVCTRWYEIAGRQSMFFFGLANKKPLDLDNIRKQKAGETVMKTYQSGR